MGIPAEQQNYADIGEVTLIKSADYQAAFWETVRVHPGLGGGDNIVVTLPPTDGMADLGKWVRVIVVDVDGGKFCRVIGFGSPNAATQKYLGKYTSYYKKYFQAKDKYNYFGDLINDRSGIAEDPQYNLGRGMTLPAQEQSVLFVWDGVSSWWAYGGIATLSGLREGSEFESDTLVSDRREFPIDIFDKGIAGQSPPDEIIETTKNIFRAVQFTNGEQIWLHAPISNARRNWPIELHLVGGAGDSGTGTAPFELKVLGVTGREANFSVLSEVTETRSLGVTSATGLFTVEFVNLANAVTPQDVDGGANVYKRASHLIMRLKKTSVAADPVNIYGAVLSYLPYGYRGLRFEEGVLN